MKKLITAMFTLTLLTGLLSGCGGTGTKIEEPSASPSPTSTVEATETPEITEEAQPETTDPPVMDAELAAKKYAPDTLVMTIGDREMNWTKYFDAVNQYAGSLFLYGLTDFNMEISEEGETIGESILEAAEDTLRQLATAYSKAGELGIAITEEQQAEIDEEIQTYADLYYGGDVDELFANEGISEEFFRFQAEAMHLYDNLLAYYFGEEGANLSDEDAIAYAVDNGYLYAKHILYLTVDDNRDPLPDGEIAEKRQRAEETLSQLQAASPEELPELFDTLMNAQSEDTGLISYPDGYYFQEGAMVDEFYEAALALEEGQISDIVETDYGYHILYRPPMSGDHIFDYDAEYNAYTLRHAAAQRLFLNMLDEWMEEVDVQYAPGFENLDLNELYSAE